MNPYGSYKSLLGNSISAVLAAVEIYNKPKFEYRSECFVILLVNAWELLFKAILSKHKIRIFEPKERGKPYLTIGLFSAIGESRKLFPKNISHRAVSENIRLLVDYRNNAVHFYNEEGFETIIYGLAQTSIFNFRDIVSYFFNRDIASEVNLALLPISFSTPPDPIRFAGTEVAQKPAIAQYLSVISQTTNELDEAGIDTGRFMTVFSVLLQSTKKIQAADFVVGIDAEKHDGLLLVSKKVDPNKSHPHQRKAILEIIGSTLNGEKFSTYVFDAIVWHRKLKEQDRYCWKNLATKTFQYSPELVTFFQSMTASDIKASLNAYRKSLSTST